MLHQRKNLAALFLRQAGLASRPFPHAQAADPLRVEASHVDAHRLGMAVYLGCDLIGRLACPTLDDQLGMKLPISGRMKAVREFVDLAFFLLILRRSGLHVFGHGSALSRSATLPPPILVSMRNAALVLQLELGAKIEGESQRT